MLGIGSGLLCYSSECGGCEGGTWGFSVGAQMYQRIVKVLADKGYRGIRELIAHFADEDDRWRWRSANVPIT